MKTPNPTQQIEDKIKEVNESKRFCPFCGYKELQTELESPFFQECLNCHEHIFMTERNLFDDMNTELENIYKKEKQEAKLSQAQTDLQTATKFKDELNYSFAIRTDYSKTKLFSLEDIKISIDTSFNKYYGVKK